MLMQTPRYCRNFTLPFVALTLMFPVYGCGHAQLKEGRDQGSLDKFAATYVKFRETLEPAKISAAAMLLDQGAPADADEDLTYYRSSYIKALNRRIDSKKRAEAAREAVEYYKSKSSPMMQDFDKHNDALNASSLELIQRANAITEDAYRKQAIQIADAARKNQQYLASLKSTGEDIYELQVKLMTKITEQEGDLNRALPAMKDALTEWDKLSARRHELFEKEQDFTKTIQEQYAAFKGMTGVTLDYNEPSASDSGPKRP
jgi:hypothetical protein